MKIFGIGAVCIDFLSFVEKFPKKDQKIRSKYSEILLGGNCSNVLRTLKQFSKNYKINLVSTIGNDSNSKLILKTLKEENIESKFILEQKMKTAFTYIIVDEETSTRTCIHSPSEKELHINFEIKNEEIDFLFLDGRQLTPSVLDFISKLKDVQILLDYEKFRNEEMEKEFLLKKVNYLVSPKDQILKLGKDKNLLICMKRILEEYSNLNFLISTLGKEGSLMMYKGEENSNFDEVNSLEQMRTFIFSTVVKPFSFFGYTILYAKIYEVKDNLVDTTGCGDAFSASVVHGILMNFEKEKILKFASRVSAEKCKYIGGCGKYNINSIMDEFN
eukprot:gene2150-2016_t